MKSNFKSSRNLQFLLRTFLASTAVFALMSAHTFADVVNVRYATAADVPLSTEGFTAEGKTLNVSLTFAPTLGKDLTLVRNTGTKFIQGHFSNLAQGQIVTLHYGGVPYHFVANYYGGTGRDLVLMGIRLDDLSAAAVEKLETKLLLALKKSRGQAPFDRPTSLRPEVHEKEGRVLVDINAPVSNELSSQVAQLGVKLIDKSSTATSLRAWLPPTQLEGVANLTAVQSISAVMPTVRHRLAPGRQ
jgi:hypothetical protein